MDSDQKNDRMIGEEQDVLDELIRQMDAVLLQLDRRLTQTEIDLKREREKCLADTYGRFIQLQDQRDTADRKLQNLYRIRDELYTRRMIFDVTESGGSGGGPEEDEIKVGLHTFMHQGKTWILSWKEEACRPFILNADLRENTCKIRGKDGTIYRTHYALKTSRDIDIHFTTVQDVTQLYPLTQEEAEGIIFDEFLKDLVERRADNEFKNIVFTIQKQQSEIIQSPYETNLIVQGCAGSGKSMIMLHRLPIILYDNASISRSSLYVITPSRAYIQMASNMCADLEIDDLNMGTLDDYYAYCIGKYVSVKSVPYGEADRTVCLTPKQLKYVYAKKRRKDIERMAKAAVKAVRFDYNKGFTRLGITNTSKSAPTSLAEQLQDGMVRSAQLLRENNRRLQDYYNVQDADKLKQEQYQKKIQQAVKENPALKKSKKYRVLEYAYLQKLKEVHEQQRDLDRHLEERIYQDILKEGGIEQQKKKKKLPALPCSSYLFLLILYIYRGCPNAVSETLITVDEAQNLAPEEYRLIRDVNQEQAVLNLFGDVRQHIAGTKGIDTWEELEEIAEFEQHSMRENYRNARQITEYCNQRFGMDMHAINLDRQEVHEWLNIEQFRTGMEQQLRGTHRAGMSAIIVTTAEEAAFILEKYADFANKMHDFAAEGILHHSRWNIMTADEVKGLEFSTVIALSGRMSDNEKYIAYTRALDTLYVYDISIRIKKSDKKKAEKKSGTDKSGKKADQKKTGSGTDKTSKKKRARSDSDTGKNDYSNSKVKKFFEDAGLQVADLREEGGSLWVIGEKDRIRSTVNKAVDLFDITGVYGSDQKAKIKAGWHTKTKL